METTANTREKNSVDDLIDSGIVQIGRNAKENPEDLTLSLFALGIANKDYPAQTPRLWNGSYKAFEMPLRNIRLFGDPDGIEEIFAALKSDQRYIGGDVGVGFKDKAWKIIDELDPIARAMESINVVLKTESGGLKGFNTDGSGYVKSLSEALDAIGKKLNNSKIVVLGGGGTSNSIVLSLAEAGANVVVLNRTVSKAESLAARANKFVKEERVKAGGREQIKDEVKDAAAVITAIDDPKSPLYQYSSLGTIEFPPSEENIEKNIDEAKKIMSEMPKDAIISDVMLREDDTATIREAKMAGLKTLDGGPMVLNQGVEAFWLVNQKELEKRGITKKDVEKTMSSL